MENNIKEKAELFIKKNLPDPKDKDLDINTDYMIGWQEGIIEFANMLEEEVLLADIPY